MTQIGQPIPDFILASHNAGEMSADGLLGMPYILFIYPKDDTRG